MLQEMRRRFDWKGVNVKRHDVFVATFVSVATVCGLLTCMDTRLPQDTLVHYLVSVIVPFDATFRTAEWNVDSQFAITALCILVWSTTIGLAVAWAVPRFVVYVRARYSDVCSGRYQCSIRELLILIALLAVLTRFAGPLVMNVFGRWQIPADMEMVRGATQVRITQFDPYTEDPGQPIVTTNKSDLESITGCLVACKKVDGYNRCMPPQYQIEFCRGGRVVLDVQPTQCCGIFSCGDAYYRDVTHAFRDVVEAVYVRVTTQNGTLPAKTNGMSSSPQ